MNRLTKAYDSGKVTLDAEHFKPLVQEAIDAEISASPLLKTVTRRLYEYEEENIMKSKLRHKSYKITAGLIVGLSILTASVLAVSAVYIALWFFPIPTMIICIGTTSYAFAKKIIRLCALAQRKWSAYRNRRLFYCQLPRIRRCRRKRINQRKGSGIMEQEGTR